MPSTRTTPPADRSLQTLTAALEKSLERGISQRFERLSRENEAQLKKLLDATLSTLSEELLRASLNVTENAVASSRGTSGEAKLGNAIGRLITLAVGNAIAGKKTSVSSAETERSKQAAALKPSKSQQQASAAAQAQKGMRNL